MSPEYISNSVEKLDNWIQNNGWEGFDPYDIKEIPWIRKTTSAGKNNFILEVFRESLFEIFNFFPLTFRKILNVEPRINAKAMGLFSSAYLDLYGSLNKKEYLNHSKDCLSWLAQNTSQGYKGMSWGYPFDWQSKMLIKKSTPNGIVTTVVGEAFWKWYKLSKEKHYLETCQKICEFLISLPKDLIDDDSLCFSYTPAFINHVHNLNLFVAEFLLKIGLEINNRYWIDTAMKAVNYTISSQLENGSFDYNGPPEKQRNFVDNYHTGFVLRMLFSIWNLTNDRRIYDSLERCYNHYINNFFENGQIPKLLAHRKYRLDIHSCAESINCLCELSAQFNSALPLANHIAEWTINNLQDKQGYFYYGILKSRFFGIIYTSKIPYIRWGQAWMIKALSNLIKHNEK